MKRNTRSIAGAISYLRRPFRLSFLDEKPWFFKVQPVRGNVIKDDEIVAYAAQAAHIPETALLMAKNALFDAVNFYVTQGMGVQVPGLGSFAPVTRVKVAQSEDECNADTIKKRIIRFYPVEEVAELGRRNNINFVENESLTNMAVGLVFAGGTDAATNFLVNAAGKVVVFGDKVYNKAGAFVEVPGSLGKADIVYAAKVSEAEGLTKWQYGSHVYTSNGTIITDLPTWA